MLQPLVQSSQFSYYFRYAYSAIFEQIPEFSDRFMQLVTAPWVYKEMLWIILPMVITILVMELYFGVYVSEELGWNSAVANSIFLLFVGIDLFRQILFTSPVFGSIKQTLIIISGIVLFLGVVMLLLNFAHALPRNLAFKVSSTLPINLYAYISIILIYTNLPHVGQSIPIDALTYQAAFILYCAAMIIFGFIHLLEPHSYDE